MKTGEVLYLYQKKIDKLNKAIQLNQDDAFAHYCLE